MLVGDCTSTTLWNWNMSLQVVVYGLSRGFIFPVLDLFTKLVCLTYGDCSVLGLRRRWYLLLHWSGSMTVVGHKSAWCPRTGERDDAQTHD